MIEQHILKTAMWVMSCPSWQYYWSTLLCYSFSNGQVLIKHQQSHFCWVCFIARNKKAERFTACIIETYSVPKNPASENQAIRFFVPTPQRITLQIQGKKPSKFPFLSSNQNGRAFLVRFCQTTSRQLSLGVSLIKLLELTTCSNPSVCPYKYR